MHATEDYIRCAPFIQPAMRALAGWPIACIHPPSQPRACIMHEDSGCTQIRSWMAGWMDGWLDACARARARACIQPASRARASIMHAESGCTQIRSCTVCMPNLGGPRSLVATCILYCMGRKDTIASMLYMYCIYCTVCMHAAAPARARPARPASH